MNEINYLKGDATSPQAKGNKIICHICNDLGGWGKGFVLAISKRWKAPEKGYREWHRNRAENDFALGKMRIIQVSDYIHVANMVAQRGMKMAKSGPPIRYGAAHECLENLSRHALELNASVHMPRIGCGLAGGKWERIEPIIKDTLCSKNIEVYVYDFE